MGGEHSPGEHIGVGYIVEKRNRRETTGGAGVKRSWIPLFLSCSLTHGKNIVGTRRYVLSLSLPLMFQGFYPPSPWLLSAHTCLLPFAKILLISSPLWFNSCPLALSTPLIPARARSSPVHTLSRPLNNLGSVSLSLSLWTCSRPKPCLPKPPPIPSVWYPEWFPLPALASCSYCPCLLPTLPQSIVPLALAYCPLYRSLLFNLPSHLAQPVLVCYSDCPYLLPTLS